MSCCSSIAKNYTKQLCARRQNAAVAARSLPRAALSGNPTTRDDARTRRRRTSMRTPSERCFASVDLDTNFGVAKRNILFASANLSFAHRRRVCVCICLYTMVRNYRWVRNMRGTGLGNVCKECVCDALYTCRFLYYMGCQTQRTTTKSFATEFDKFVESNAPVSQYMRNAKRRDGRLMLLWTRERWPHPWCIYSPSFDSCLESCDDLEERTESDLLASISKLDSFWISNEAEYI